jgi:hypothetical protein
MTISLNPLRSTKESAQIDVISSAVERPPVAGRTREASSGWPQQWQGTLGRMGLAHDGGRPSAANVVNPCGYRSETGLCGL